MIPCSGILYSTPSAFNSASTSATTSLIFSTSHGEIIIGYITERFPYTAARSNARICVLNTSGHVKQIRIAR